MNQRPLRILFAAPVWARYGSFRGQPPIAGTLRWNVAERSITLSGTRGSQPFAQTLAGAPRTIPSDTSRDVSPDPVAITHARRCERCGQPIADTAPLRGALLRQTLPAGRLARATARALRPLSPRAA